LLESAFDGLQPAQGIEQLQSGFVERVGAGAELLIVLDSELEAVDCDARLVRQFVLKGCGPRMGLGLDHF
jgi:hypothetical protein